MNELGVVEPPRSVRWETVEDLAAKNAKDMAALHPNRLLFILVAWFIQIEMFRDAENETIIGGTPTAPERQAHKQALATGISQGEILVSWLRKHDVTAQLWPRLADIEATLEELYDRQRVFFGGMTEQRRTQILDEVFGAS
jgi:hypothetical protein